MGFNDHLEVIPNMNLNFTDSFANLKIRNTGPDVISWNIKTTLPNYVRVQPARGVLKASEIASVVLTKLNKVTSGLKFCIEAIVSESNLRAKDIDIFKKRKDEIMSCRMGVTSYGDKPSLDGVDPEKTSPGADGDTNKQEKPVATIVMDVENDDDRPIRPLMSSYQELAEISINQSNIVPDSPFSATSSLLQSFKSVDETPPHVDPTVDTVHKKVHETPNEEQLHGQLDERGDKDIEEEPPKQIFAELPKQLFKVVNDSEKDHEDLQTSSKNPFVSEGKQLPANEEVIENNSRATDDSEKTLQNGCGINTSTQTSESSAQLQTQGVHGDTSTANLDIFNGQPGFNLLEYLRKEFPNPEAVEKENDENSFDKYESNMTVSIIVYKLMKKIREVPILPISKNLGVFMLGLATGLGINLFL